jgi:hypothetical protein
MTRLSLAFAVVLLVRGAGADAGPERMVVADVPYATVWAAAQAALREYPTERAADGEIVTGWRDRPPRAEEVGFERVSERITVRVEAFAERITRVTVTAELRGWRNGQWVMIEDVGAARREVLARIRAALG